MKRECENCIKRKTLYCPSTNECMNTDDMPYYQNRIMLLEENEQLKGNWNKLREFILEEGFEINTREYGSLDVIDKNVILEKIQELERSDRNE